MACLNTNFRMDLKAFSDVLTRPFDYRPSKIQSQCRQMILAHGFCCVKAKIPLSA